MAQSWVPKREQLWREIEGEEKKKSALERGLDWAFIPFTLVGESVRGLFPGGGMKEAWQNISQSPEYQQSGFWGQRDIEWKEMLPGGKIHETYRNLPMWQQMVSEIPAMVATGGVSAAGITSKLGTKAVGKGVGAAVARGGVKALKPMVAFEELPNRLITKAGQKLGLTAERLQNALPHVDPNVKPAVARKQLKVVAQELVEDIGLEPAEKIPVTNEMMQRTLGQKMKDTWQGFADRTYRMENMLLQMDKFKEGGKFTQAFWRPVGLATDKLLTRKSVVLKDFTTFLKTNGIDLNKMLTERIPTRTFPYSARFNLPYEVVKEGKTLALTSSERIGIALHMENPENVLRIVKRNNIPKGVLSEISESLTPEEKKVVDYLRQYFNTQYDEVNKAFRQIKGKDMPKVEGSYMPLQADRRALGMEGVLYDEPVIDERLLKYGVKWASRKITKGFTKPRVKSATVPVKLDALDIFMTHMQGIEHYKAFSPVVRDLQSLMKNKTLREAIRVKYGNPRVSVMDKWLDDIAATDPMRVTQQSEKMLRTLRVNATTAVLGFNITTALKQFPSFVGGMSEIGMIPAVKGLFTYLSNPRATHRLIKEVAPQINARVLERELAENRAMASLAKQISGKKTARDIFMILTTTMDRLAVNSLWRGGFDDAIKQGLKTSEAAEYATRAIRRTQPFFSAKDVPEYWKSGEFMKALTMFTNQLNQYWNYYRFHMVGKMGAGQITKSDFIKRSMEMFVIPSLMIGAITRSRPAQDAEEMTKDMVSMGLSAFPVWGRMLAGSIYGWTGGSDILTLELLDKINQIGYQVNKKQWDKLGWSIPESLGYLTGIPTAQPRRTIRALLEDAQNKSDAWMRYIWGDTTIDKRSEDKTEIMPLDWNKIRPSDSGVWGKLKLPK